MTPADPPAPPCTLVVFGAAGDLTKRLLMPAIYNLAGSGLLDDGLKIVGLDHNERTSEGWRDELSAALESFTHDPGAEFHPGHIDERTWSWVASRLEYKVFDFERDDGYRELASHVGAGNALFYLATSARFFGPIVDKLGAAGLLHENGGAFRRVAIEKPFGSDVASARALNARILKVGRERQYYRVDHFLGKEPVQGIFALRFGNGIYEPMWRREHVDHVQITAAETLGVEERGAFYEATGALRDMVPNHLFSLLTMIAMEPPGGLDTASVRNEKAKLVRAIRPVPPENAVRGQYAAGPVDGKSVPGYRSEDKVASDSRTETYAALKVEIDNWRWSGVPFYLRTGKRLTRHLTTIAIRFRPAPQRMFAGANGGPDGNVITLAIAPDAGTTTTFSAKEPGPEMRLGTVCTSFSYGEHFDEPPRVGYETLLYDAMRGSQLHFQREDMVDASWAALQPVLDAWKTAAAPPQLYAPGSAGPADADALLERDGRRWLPL